MTKVWLVLVAVWKIVQWWAKRDAETRAKREELKKETANAIKTGDTRSLHRILSRL